MLRDSNLDIIVAGVIILSIILFPGKAHGDLDRNLICRRFLHCDHLVIKKDSVMIIFWIKIKDAVHSFPIHPIIHDIIFRLRYIYIFVRHMYKEAIMVD